MKLKIEGIELILSEHSLKILWCEDWNRFHSTIKDKYFGVKIKNDNIDYVLKL